VRLFEVKSLKNGILPSFVSLKPLNINNDVEPVLEKFSKGIAGSPIEQIISIQVQGVFTLLQRTSSMQNFTPRYIVLILDIHVVSCVISHFISQMSEPWLILREEKFKK
jgi:hypothetical protein